MIPLLDDALGRHAMRRLGASLCGRYTLRHVIGIGGMATVYAGVHRNGHGVAIKILHEGLAADPDVERLFRREAQLANKVDHAGVVPVIDDDVTDDGCVFLVMPLLDGETLRARAERLGGRLPTGEAIVVARAVLDALAAAHAKKIVHRDIKPENIFVTCAGDVRVLDFGIGRFFHTNDTATSTHTGRTIGTPAFMAPEQALGRQREVDGRTDLWALGATLFSLLSGRFVHEADGPGEVRVLAATKASRPLVEVAPDVPPALCAVIDRALAFHREARWSDACEMARALLEATEGSDLPTLAAAPREAIDDELHAAPTHVPDLAASRPGVPETFLSSVRTPSAEPAKPAAMPVRGRSKVLRWLGLVPAGVAMIAVCVAVAFAGSRLHKQPATTSASSTPRLSLDVQDIEAISPLMTVSSDVLAEYHASLQLWRDASRIDGLLRLHALGTAHADFAAAHLWCVLIAGYVDSKVRDHYVAATVYRRALTNRQADVLGALGPSMSDPPDVTTTLQQLEHLTDVYPDDVDIRLALALRYERLGDTVRGFATLAPLFDERTPPSEAFSVRAQLHSRDGDTRGTLDDLAACMDANPTASECLDESIILATNEGDCPHLEALCRKLIARDPGSPSGYDCMGDALYSAGAPESAVRAAMDEEVAHTAAYGRESERAAHDVQLAVAYGRLDEASRLAEAWQKAALDYGHAAAATVYQFRVALDVELSRATSARRLATEFSDKARSWSRADMFDAESETIYLESMAGMLDPQTRARRRAGVLAAQDDSYGDAARRWVNGFVETSFTEAEGVEALAHMPSRAIAGPTYRNARADYLLGHVFELGHDPSRAREFFSRAAASCALNTAFSKTQSAFELARLAEPNVADACPLYLDVLRRWGASPDSRTVASARERVQALQCRPGLPL